MEVTSQCQLGCVGVGGAGRTERTKDLESVRRSKPSAHAVGGTGSGGSLLGERWRWATCLLGLLPASHQTELDAWKQRGPTSLSPQGKAWGGGKT